MDKEVFRTLQKVILVSLRALSVLLVLGIVLFIGINTAVPVHCQEKVEKRQLYTFSGIVSFVNWVESKIGIRYVVNRGTADAFFSVPKEAMITKDKRPTWFSEVNIGDRVTVTYYADHAGVMNIASINIEV